MPRSKNNIDEKNIRQLKFNDCFKQNNDITETDFCFMHI